MGPATKPCGVLVIDKPRGPTSHDVVAHLRRTLRTREVGHAGTLDPMATGVLVVAVGEATKLVPWLTAHNKAYQATVALGIQTDTLDAEGAEVARQKPSAELVDALTNSAIGHGALSPLFVDALAIERQRTSQVPPIYSAIKTDGERSFERARRGEATVLAARDVRVIRLDLTACSVEVPSVSIELDVQKGYYVRALARDFAAALGTVGHLTMLRRTRSGPFTIDEAMPMNALRTELLERLSPLPLSAARALPVARLSETGVRDARYGRIVRSAEIAVDAAGPSAWLDADGTLVAIGETDAEGQGRVLRGFSEPPKSDEDGAERLSLAT